MAVTLTVAQLQAALRLGDSTEETNEVTRLLAYCTEAVTQYAPSAEAVAHDEAVRRMAGYLFDQPEAGRGDGYANAMRNSGAGRILLPYVIHRAGYADAVAAAQTAVGTPGNPVTGIAYAPTTHVLTVTYGDGTTEEFTLTVGVTGVDQEARNLATAAQTTANTARADAQNAETTAGQAEATANLAQTQAQNANASSQANTDRLDNLDIPGTSEIQAAARLVIANWAEAGNTDIVPDGKHQRKVFIVTGAVDASTDIAGTIPNDVVLDFSQTGTIKAYRKDSSTSPFFSLLGTAGGTSGTPSQHVPAAWAVQGNQSLIPTDKIPFVIPPWLSDPANNDIAWALLNETLKPFTQAGSAAIAATDTDFAGRLLPDASGGTNGQIAKIVGGAWALSSDETGSGSGGKVWIPGDFRKAEDVLDPLPPAQAGQVYMRLRYTYTVNQHGALSLTDEGNGFAKYNYAADGTVTSLTRTLSTTDATDFADYFGGDTTAVMERVTTLPGAASAQWGVFYGFAAGILEGTERQVSSIWFRRREDTDQQLFLPIRFDLAGGRLQVHGFRNFGGTTDGGALSPESGFVELAEYHNAVNGKWYMQLILPAGNLVNHLTAVVMRFRNHTTDDTAVYSSLNMARDADYVLEPTNHRYASAEYNNPLIVPGRSYDVRWRHSGETNDLIFSSAQHMRQLVDDEKLNIVTQEVREELYHVEDQVTNVFEFTDVGNYTTTEQTTSGAVQDTGIALPSSGRFLLIEIGGEEDVLWYRRAHLDNAGPPIPGSTSNNSIYLTSFRPMRMGRTGMGTGNLGLTNAFDNGNLIQAGVTIHVSVVG